MTKKRWSLRAAVPLYEAAGAPQLAGLGADRALLHTARFLQTRCQHLRAGNDCCFIQERAREKKKRKRIKLRARLSKRQTGVEIEEQRDRRNRKRKRDGSDIYVNIGPPCLPLISARWAAICCWSPTLNRGIYFPFSSEERKTGKGKTPTS